MADALLFYAPAQYCSVGVDLTEAALGEREIIRLLQGRFELPKNLPLPFGDDVSALTLNHSQDDIAVLKSDMLVGKSDVPAGMSLFDTARKAVVMNVSDFAAKGASPSAVMVALGLPSDLANAKSVFSIAEGLNSGAREYGAYVLGGDTSWASDLVISVMLFGTANHGKLMLRSGAHAGDVLAVTGLFGKPPAGLRILQGNVSVADKVSEVLVDSVFRPKARLSEGLSLANCGCVTSCMDSSDGLALSLYELSGQNGVGFVVYDLPIAPEAAEFALSTGLSSSNLALYGGEEYELVLTVKPRLWDGAQSAVAAAGGHLYAIGKATSQHEIILNLNGKKHPILPKGWEHFKSAP